MNKPEKHITALFKLFLVGFLIFNLPLNAQNKGIVVEKESKNALPGVSVQLKNKSGTITNEQGIFYFKSLPKVKDTDTLTVSHIGYIPKRITLSELKKDNHTIYLDKEIQNLDDVAVIGYRASLKPYIHYKTVTSIKEGLHSFGSVLINNKIYIVGGDLTVGKGTNSLPKVVNREGTMLSISSSESWSDYNKDMYVYNIEKDSWDIEKSKFKKRAYHGVNYLNGKIYVLGGKRLSTSRKKEYLLESIEVYDVKKDTVLVDNTNPHQAVNFASTICGENIVVAGGSVRYMTDGILDKKEYTNKVHMLNLNTGYWYELEDMPNGKEVKGISIENKLYLLGGFRSKALREIETYDLSTGEWNMEGELPYHVERPGIVHHKDIIYIFENGRIQTYNIHSKESKVYSIDLPLIRSELVLVDDNTLFIVGGYRKDDISLIPSSNIYSIHLDEFNKTSPQPLAAN